MNCVGNFIINLCTTIIFFTILFNEGEGGFSHSNCKVYKCDEMIQYLNLFAWFDLFLNSNPKF